MCSNPFIMSPVLLVVLSALVVVAQAQVPRLGFGSRTLGLTRIVGGIEATKGEFPHQITLQWGLPPLIGYQHFCGGTIIGSQWILTAGHCVHAVPSYGSFVVKSGKHQIKLSEASEQTIEVVASYVHELYIGGVAPYDIALLKLKSPINLNKDSSVISLPNAGSTFTGSVILSGWGSISPAGTAMPSALQKIDLDIVDFETCKSALEELVGPNPVHITNVCTGPLTGGRSACSGDSGGPLIAKNAAGVSVVVGVVSWGVMPCGTEGAPSVYTGVASFVDWIQSTMMAH